MRDVKVKKRREVRGGKETGSRSVAAQSQSHPPLLYPEQLSTVTHVCAQPVMRGVHLGIPWQCSI